MNMLTTYSQYIYLETALQKTKRGPKQCFIKNAARQRTTIFQTMLKKRSFFFLKRSATSTTSFLIQLKCYANSAITERHFDTRSKRNLTSAIKFTSYNVNFAFLHMKTERENQFAQGADFCNILFKIQPN